MWINRVRMQHWRGFIDSTFEIPKPANTSKHIVVVGAKNGGGKTSLLKAIRLCLFGHKGIILNEEGLDGYHIAEESKQENLKRTEYCSYIDASFNNTARETCQFARVKVDFQLDTHELAIERTWRYDSNNMFKIGNDPVKIWKNNKELPPPSLASNSEFQQKYINANVLPYYLTQFFLFDGGNVQKLATTKMQQNIKSGIEGILGVPLINDFKIKLEEYNEERKKQGRANKKLAKQIKEKQKEKEKSEDEFKSLSQAIRELQEEIFELQTAADNIYQQLISLEGNGSLAEIGEPHRIKGELMEKRNREHVKLLKCLTEDFSIALVGSEIIESTIKRLGAENNRENWERDRKSGDSKYDRFVENLRKNGTFELPLSEGNTELLKEQLRKSWTAIWHPMSGDCAKDIWNPELSSYDRSTAISKLDELSGDTNQTLIISWHEKQRLDNEIKKIIERIEERNYTSTQNELRIKTLRKQLNEKNISLQKKQDDVARKELELPPKKAHLNALSQELGRLYDRASADNKGNDDYEHIKGYTGKILQLIANLREKSYARHITLISEKITAAYIFMAYKDYVRNITITPECAVKLTTDFKENLKLSEFSHGESEVFALALIASISQVSNKNFPYIIDTPLGNLDKHHRKTVLKYFSEKQSNQTFLLSTDEEVTFDKYDFLKEHVAHKFLITQEQQVNRVHVDTYFGELQ